MKRPWVYMSSPSRSPLPPPKLRYVFSEFQISKHASLEGKILSLCTTWICPHTSMIRDPLSLITTIFLSVCSHSWSPCPDSSDTDTPDTEGSPSTEHSPTSPTQFHRSVRPMFQHIHRNLIIIFPQHFTTSTNPRELQISSLSKATFVTVHD